MKDSNSKSILIFSIFSLFLFILIVVQLSLKVSAWSTVALFTSFFLVFFLPGFLWGKIFFPGKIDKLFRIVLSVALSIIFVPLVEFYSNFLLKIPISRISIMIEISFFSLIGLFVLLFVKKNSRENEN